MNKENLINKLENEQIETGAITGFSEACYNANSINELRYTALDAPDVTDCKNWGIDKMEWTESIKIAKRMLQIDRILAKIA